MVMNKKITKRAAEIKIARQRCKGCGLCIENCRNKLIVWEKEVNNRGVHPAFFSGGECVGCAFCAYVCPESCIEVFE